MAQPVTSGRRRARPVRTGVPDRAQQQRRPPSAVPGAGAQARPGFKGWPAVQRCQHGITRQKRGLLQQAC